MPPKRRDREVENKVTNRMDQVQTDHELFLQAFQKPTQIYRFLRTRNLACPTFLSRTLSYMRHRISRRHNKRKDFKIDKLLEKVLAKQQQEENNHCTSSYINLTFTGFHDKLSAGASNAESVLVETILLKLCHKKRKDVTSPVMQMSVGQSRVARNPDRREPLSTAMAVSVPSNDFHFNNGHLVKSHVLVFRVSIVPAAVTAAHVTNGTCNGNLSDSEEPPVKRRKNGRLATEEEKVFGGELIVFNKHRQCMLTEGDYELVLQEAMLTKDATRKQRTWETVEETEKDSSPYSLLNLGPTLKFTLRWSDDLISGAVPMPMPITTNGGRPSPNHRQPTNLVELPNGNAVSLPGCNQLEVMSDKKKPRIFYQFLYNNNTRQQTEAREDLNCPWCSLNSSRLYSLLKHLKICHARFIFTYVPHPKGARIDVSVNEFYDGSYVGNPHDLLAFPPGFAFSRDGPVRRTPVTTVTVCRPKRTPPSLTEFLEPDDSEYDGVRPYIVGHNRLYHHTETCHPIRPQEIENDSESENDPEWLQIKTEHMIDEFTDVNEGEKELMKMWNLHVMKFGFVGDCQIPLACKMFVTHHRQDILRKKLYRNFVIHLCNLLDFGLIGAAALYQCMRLMNGGGEEGAAAGTSQLLNGDSDAVVVVATHDKSNAGVAPREATVTTRNGHSGHR